MFRDARLIVMGVAGCGKSTLARQLAGAFFATLVEGDALHTADARAKMASGTGLSDGDRWPWLDRVAAAVAAAPAPVVATCSALRLVYRDRLRAALGPRLRFVWLDVDRAELADRLARRAGHYAGPALLDSQLAIFEPPSGEADVLRLLPSDAPVARVTAWLA